MRSAEPQRERLGSIARCMLALLIGQALASLELSSGSTVLRAADESGAMAGDRLDLSLDLLGLGAIGWAYSRLACLGTRRLWTALLGLAGWQGIMALSALLELLLGVMHPVVEVLASVVYWVDWFALVVAGWCLAKLCGTQELARGARLWRRFMIAWLVTFYITLLYLIGTSGSSGESELSTSSLSIAGLAPAVVFWLTIVLMLSWFWLRACLGTRSEALERAQASAQVE